MMRRWVWRAAAAARWFSVDGQPSTVHRFAFDGPSSVGFALPRDLNPAITTSIPEFDAAGPAQWRIRDPGRAEARTLPAPDPRRFLSTRR